MKRDLSAAILILAAVAGMSVARADERNFLGIQVGGAPPQECPFEVSFGSRSYRYPSGQVCVTSLGYAPGTDPIDLTGTKELIAHIDSKTAPNGVESVYVDIVGGIVQSVLVSTAGFSVQEQLLSDLTAKYGKPKKLERSPVQTGIGAKFERIEAEWRKPDLNIDYRGMGTSITEGHISVRTDAGQAAFLEKYGGQRSF